MSSALDEAAAALTQMRAERAGAAAAQQLQQQQQQQQQQTTPGGCTGLQQAATGVPPGSSAPVSALAIPSAAVPTALQVQQPGAAQQAVGPGT